MADSTFRGRPVLGECDSDLFYLWLLVHTLDDSFGQCHLMRQIPEFSDSWISLLGAIDARFEGCFDTDGDSGELVTIMLR